MNILFIIKIILIVVALGTTVFSFNSPIVPLICLSIAMLIDVIQEKA